MVTPHQVVTGGDLSARGTPIVYRVAEDPLGLCTMGRVIGERRVSREEALRLGRLVSSEQSSGSPISAQVPPLLAMPTVAPPHSAAGTPRLHTPVSTTPPMPLALPQRPLTHRTPRRGTPTGAAWPFPVESLVGQAGAPVLQCPTSARGTSWSTTPPSYAWQSNCSAASGDNFFRNYVDARGRTLITPSGSSSAIGTPGGMGCSSVVGALSAADAAGHTALSTLLPVPPPLAGAPRRNKGPQFSRSGSVPAPAGR